MKVDICCQECARMSMLINIAVHTCKTEPQIRQKDGKPGIYWNGPDDCNISFIGHKSCFPTLEKRQWFCNEVNKCLAAETKKCLCGYESLISEWREISVTDSSSTAIYIKSRLAKRKRDQHAELHSCPKCGLVYNTDTD